MKIRQWLQSLSFRTGVIVLLCCIPFYILSFAQMLLPLSTAAKGILWTVLFGMAKTCQYGGLTILGVEGYNRLKGRLKRNNADIWQLAEAFAAGEEKGEEQVRQFAQAFRTAGLNEAADEMEVFAKQEGHHGATLRAMVEKYRK